MPKSLKDNLNNRYFDAANRLKPKTSKRRIVAYVEAYDDVFFWRTVLSRFENDKRYFEVMLPTRVGKLERGKKAAMMKLFSGKVGQSMIACVDADYDYLSQGANETSSQILNNPYILHTYAYSIENMQCYAPTLRGVCVAVTLNDHQIFDMAEYLREYSQAIFPLFVWSIWHYRHNIYKNFTISDFNAVIETGNFTISKAPDILQRVRRKVGSRISQLQRQYPDAKESYLEVKESLKELGVTADTTYLYIQGHHLFDNVVVPMMKKVCSQLVTERQNEISRQSQHSTQRHNELSCYNNSIEDIESMLKKNVGYALSPTFQRIIDDAAKIFPMETPTPSESDEEKGWGET
ncbi:MAG: DUF4435 domain-containing protein [Prevotella sp.]|nr:DUF4435 domain-containing protein [Prevotella sp.]